MARRTLQPEYFPFLDYRRFPFSLGVTTEAGVWLSGCTAVRHDPERKTMVVEGGLEEQTTVIFAKMQLSLASCGKTLNSLSRLVRYVTPDVVPQLAALDALQARLVGGAPSTSTIVVNRLLRKTAVIEIEAYISGETEIEYLPTAFGTTAAEAVGQVQSSLAKCGPGATLVRANQFLAPGDQPPAALPAKAGMVVLSPVLPNGYEGVQIEAVAARSGPTSIVFASATGDAKLKTMEAQCRDVYDRIAASLEGLNSGMDRVIKTTEFITPEGLASYKDTAPVRRQAFEDPYPAATGVICEGLPQAGSLIAMEVVASVEPL